MIQTGFSGLDLVAGGLAEAKNYIVYGNIGVGKTTFGLQFLYHGLLEGETVALVTRRSFQTVFDHGRAFGMEMEPFAAGGRFVLFEYLPKVVENATRLKDDGEIPRELRLALGSQRITRLIFDPITPLLATPSDSAAIFRARSLVQSVSDLGATVLYVFDTPEGEAALAASKDFVYGVLRFESTAFASQNRLVLERLPGVSGRPADLSFEVTPGVGLVEVAAGAAAVNGEAGPAGIRKILLIESQPEELLTLHELLGGLYTLVEADGAADGMAKVAAEAPDLVLMEKDSEGVDGMEFCKRLRQNRINVPIVLLSDPIRRARDKVEIMAAGADECLERPIDGRILKMRIQNLLRRYDGARDRLKSGTLDASVTSGFERDKTTSTTNLAYFHERLQRDVAYSTQNGISFGMIVMHLPEANGNAVGEDLYRAAESLIREYDLIYVGRRGIAVLMPETEEKGIGVFLKRFRESYPHTPAPTIESRCFDRREPALPIAEQLLESLESAPAPGQAGRV